MSREGEDAGPTLLGVAIAMLVLVLTTTSLRITVRMKRSALGRDDYTIAAASLLTIGRVTCQFISVAHGNGRHREFLSIEDYQYINFLTWLTQLFLFPILCLLKISVCFLVLRIKNTKPLRYGLWALIVLLVLSTFLPEIVLLAECDPVSAYWTSQHEKCWNPNVRIYSIYFQTSVSVFADVVCTLLPIAVVWHLTLTLKNKIAVCGLMSLGVISTAFACVRASSLGLQVNDLSWAYCWAAIWGNLELGFGILGANLALARTYYDVFKRGLDSIATKTRGSTHHNTHKTTSQSNSNSNSSNSKHRSASAYALSFLSSSRKSPPNQTLATTHSDTAWDGGFHNPHSTHSLANTHTKGTTVQVASGGREHSVGSAANSDEVFFGAGAGAGEMAIRREVEISVEAEDVRRDSEGGSSYGYERNDGAWDADLESGVSGEERREERAAGRAF